MVASVCERTFDASVLEADGPVIVSFWTPWCGPCRLLTQSLEQIDHSVHSVKLVQVNADENFKLTNRYRLSRIPTLILFHQGKVICRIDTFETRDDIRAQLTALLEQLPFIASA